MRPAGLKRLVKTFRYKPGLRFRVDSSGDVEISAHVLDTYHPGRRPMDPPRAYVVITPRLLAAWDSWDVIERVHEAVKRLELHEADEWFKVRNRRVFDPHR